MKDDKRKDYISKEAMYMLMARIVAKRSKDPNTQVGAVIVSDTDRILSVGYNGFPNGCSDDEFPWGREGEEINTKYPYTCHSELNAILNFRGDLKALSGSTLYVTLFPCHECAKAIIQTGIKHVVYLSNKYKDTDDFKEACYMFNAAGVTTEQFTMPAIDMVKVVMGTRNAIENSANLDPSIAIPATYDAIIDAIR